MKKKLIKLSESKGFISKILYIIKPENFPLTEEEVKVFNNLKYYLWLCEFQKWLREIHKIEVSCIPAYSSIMNNTPNFLNGDYLGKKYEAQYCCFVNDNRDDVLDDDIDDYICYHDTYEQALEIGLYEALKLIKINK